MIDLNHILLFIACISPLVMLAQTLRRGGLYRSWRLASFAVLLVTGVAWLMNRDTAGFVGGGAWLALLLLPSVGLRKVSELANHQRYAAARRLSRPLRLVHPSASLRLQEELFRGLELAQTGDFSAALSILAPLRNNQTNVGRQAIAQSFRLRGEWSELVGWIRSEVPAAIRRIDFALMPIYLRALGECGMRDELVLEFGSMLAATSPSHQPAWSYHANMRTVLAFCGRLARTDHVPLSGLPHDVCEFWLGTDELAAGEISPGRLRLEKLRSATADQLVLSEIAQRLDTAELIVKTPLSGPGFALLDWIEQSERPPPSAFGSGTQITSAVAIFIALNLIMFLAEMKLGGSTNPLTLHRLGAMEPWAIRYGGQYWRMLTSLFLHYGPLHLLFNLYALFVIGPGLERIIGSIRFAFYYLLAGIGSSIGVFLLRLSDLSRPEQLVGASGCVMGIVGVWAGYLVRHRHEPFAGRRLKNIVLIVAIQTAFDLSTPQISMTAHLSGLLTGVVLGLLPGSRSTIRSMSRMVRRRANLWNA
ncbi:MAG TPA: rhomboid family intramembrane serine protease [Chthoniobacterales bacterium]|nr:rhomboid family intramembrane serine protease [Chthoniobacterales bacterium]